jgi:hypothetical protein
MIMTNGGCGKLQSDRGKTKMFEIYTDGLRTASRAFAEGSGQLNRNAYDIEDVKHMLSGMSSMGAIISSLNYLQNDVRREASQERALFETGIWIARRYDDCEDEIISNMDNEKFEISVPQFRVIRFSRNWRSNRRINMQVLNEILDLFH